MNPVAQLSNALASSKYGLTIANLNRIKESINILRFSFFVAI